MDPEWMEAYEAQWEARLKWLEDYDAELGREVVRDMALLLLFFVLLYGALNHGYPVPSW